MNIKLFSVLAVAALAATPVLAAPSCLQLGQIYSWNAPDNKTLIVEDNWHQKFKLSLMGYCQNLTFKERIGFKAFGGTQLSCLSKGDYVLVRDPGFPQRCPIMDIVPYTPQMEAADKAAKAAKQQGGNP
ncbi:MAG TPA: DUF6491 family protein [Rhizomicrobium sp.]|nr:DUF6491 family protein [Rhizomicrobium sp.]